MGLLVAVLVFFLQSFPLLVPAEATKTAFLPLTNTNEVKVRCVKSERKALLRFKENLTDPSDRLASWVGKECCNWKGVFCDIQTGNVIRLDLNDKSGNCIWKKKGYFISGNSSSCLGGNISPALQDLQHLEFLDFGGNDFQGLATPSFLGSLGNLQYLNLSHSSLIGIPPSFGNLSSLRYLDLYAYSYPYDNAESSWIKDLSWVSGLSSLRYLDLSFIDLSLATNWLEDFNKLPCLVTLRLQNSSLHYRPYSFLNWNMTSLSYLSLSQNNFVNAVLPKWLSNATAIETLYIRYNDIEGPISNVEWGKLCNLRELYLMHNKLNGDISRVVEGLSSCSNTTIEVLRLGDNTLTGQLPNSLGHLKKLRILTISINLISGTIPTSIEHLSRLENPIPPWLWTLCSQLQWLDLSDNQIGGTLPRSVRFPTISSWTVLDFYFSYYYGVVVDLSSNHFHARVKRLSRLDLSDNHLSGTIPDWWYDLQQLQVIDLSGNYLSVSIPPSICSPPSLFWLRVSRNNLSGEFPKSLSNCKSLLTLDIGENKINGTIPEWFGKSLLSLQKLRMTSSIPSCLGSLRALKSVKFYKWFPNYGYFNYVFTPKMKLVKKGTMMTYTFTLDQVNLIDLSCNNLHGEISNEITGLSALGTLNLSCNQLSGRIPENIGRMQQLETLDLSSNNLSGSIPLSMTSITSLSHLNLSYNNMHGPIPTTYQFGTFTDPSCFEGNPKLCGKPLITECSSPGKKEMKKIIEDNDYDEHEIRLCFFVSAAVGFVVVFLATFSSLMIKKSWGYCYFHFLEEVGERIIRCCLAFMTCLFSGRRT
ncbi:uncharacterized protein LOC107831860 [Nicotiana tabacum]|uniref:Uncharacterized protein LOC107831860 n=1 Tax=Nicotiana tabacum TaxID=4097 RepID=A0AC58TDV5_TOBAC